MAFLLGALYAHGPALPSAGDVGRIWGWETHVQRPRRLSPRRLSPWAGDQCCRARGSGGPSPAARSGGQTGVCRTQGWNIAGSLPRRGLPGPPRPGAKRQSADVGGRCEGTRGFVSMGCGRRGFDCPALSGMTSRLLELITELVKCEPA